MPKKTTKKFKVLKETRNDAGQLHSFNDLPALITDTGCKLWYKNNQCHRDNDLPAITGPNNEKTWVRHGKVHRENDLPAVIGTNNEKMWIVNGKIHRENDLPAVIENGLLSWFQNDKPFREGGKPVRVDVNNNQAAFMDEITKKLTTASYEMPEEEKRRIFMIELEAAGDQFPNSFILELAAKAKKKYGITIEFE